MHQCECCHTYYKPRAQVKNPRACSRPECQLKRQRSNEKAWRERHRHLSTGEYHRIRRKQRLRRLLAIAEAILKCLEIGAQLLNQAVDRSQILEFLRDFIEEVGIRRANKFWPLQNDQIIAGLG